MSAELSARETHYRVLAALVRQEAREVGDPAGWHHVIINVLAEIRASYDTSSDLADAIYEVIAASVLPSDTEEAEQS